MKYLWIMFFGIIVMTGCGTVKTVAQGDEEVARELRIARSYCDELFRVYSGVSYNICIMNSKRAGIIFEPLALLYIADTALSAVTDTIVAPYTIYLQQQDGNIDLR